jgi:transcriptional regulator with XRE-family HTH domain
MATRTSGYTAVGNRIASLEKGQVAIGEALRISQQAISKKLRGECRILLSDLERLAKHYEVPVTYFLEPEDMDPASSRALEVIRNSPGSHQDLAMMIAELSGSAAEMLLAEIE